MTVWPAHLPHDVEFDVKDLLVAESIPRAWGRWFRETPERLAIVMAETNQSLTYGQLDEDSRAFASHLSSAGLGVGDRFVLSASTSIEMIVAYVGAQRLGLVVVPMSNALTRTEIDYIVGDVQPAGAFVDDPDRAAWMGELKMICGPETVLLGLELPSLDETYRDDLALIAYTSGTTGAPKGAMLTSGNLLASAEALRIAWRWGNDDTLVLALPLFHMHGLGVGLNGTLAAGACAVVLSKFGAESVLDAIAAFEATMFFGVPTMFVRLSASPRASEMERLRLIVSGSAPLPADLYIKLMELTGQRVVERYGMTETVITVSNPYEGDRRPGSVGLPLPGVDLHIDETGELLVRGPSVFRGYWNRPEETAESFSDDGWFRTGDLGSFDADGYLRIVGRSKDLIISGGYNVYPREVEDVLRRHAHVEDVAVAGVPSDEWGEIVAAWIVADGEVDSEELMSLASRYLAPYKLPRIITIVDQLPRNSLGKVLKHALPTP
jgi:malonyl-CoA/methylmalonyl-CoA synthetase